MHGRSSCNIRQDLVQRGLLGAGQPKCQPRPELSDQSAVILQLDRVFAATAKVELLQAQPVSHQLFQGEPPLAGVGARQQRFDVGALGRSVQESNRLAEFGVALGQPVMQVVDGVGLLHDRHGLLDESAQPLLVQPLGGRIDRGQGGARRFRLGADDAVFPGESFPGPSAHSGHRRNSEHACRAPVAVAERG